jgi:hypothetical protein
MHKCPPTGLSDQPAVPPAGPAAPSPENPQAGPPPEPLPRKPLAGPKNNQKKAKRAVAGTEPPEKRRKKTIDIDETFRIVDAALAKPAPPLLPTPQSLFGMLCGVFELEFPGRLPQRAVEQALQSLGEKE